MAKKTLSNEEFIQSLRANPAYSHVDIDIEMGKASAWCLVNRRQNTPRFFVNWLNRIDRPLVPARRPDPGGNDYQGETYPDCARCQNNRRIGWVFKENGDLDVLKSTPVPCPDCNTKAKT